MISAICLFCAVCLAIFTLRAALHEEKRFSSTLLAGIITCVFFVGFVIFFTINTFTITSYIIAVFWALVIVNRFDMMW